jgi:predicted metal-binding protein
MSTVPLPMPQDACITELTVCTTCRPAGTSREEPAAGERLLQQMLALASFPQPGQTAVQTRVRVRGAACMSSCSRACTIALQAPGKHSYVFGDLAPDPDSGPDARPDLAAQILACAYQHAESPDGLLAWNARPERLRRGIVVRLPPLRQPTPCAEPEAS